MNVATTDTALLGYLAQRDVSPQWRGFLTALVETLDANMEAAGRDALLRAIGARMGATLPLRPAGTLAELNVRMNEMLATMGWGFVSLELEEADQSLGLVHRAAPCLPVAGDEAGRWLSLVLEGLYGAWLAAQQGSQAGPARLGRVQAVPGLMRFRFGG